MNQHASALASYRDDVAGRIEVGEAFGHIEDAIDGVADLTTDEKAALWLFAVALRDRGEKLRHARAHPVAVL